MTNTCSLPPRLSQTAFLPYFFSHQGISLSEELGRFPAVHLEDLGSAALLDRQDTKFLFRQDWLSSLLRGLEQEYQILEIARGRIFQYRTVYYDTPDLLFYHQHHAGTQPRWKIRQRIYLNSGSTFLEIKCRDNHDRTHKTRLKAAGSPAAYPILVNELAGGALPVQPASLQAVLETSYSRVTLVHAGGRERITLDFQLSFSAGKRSRRLPGLMIAEVKQSSRDRQSPAIKRFKDKGVRPVSFSKYCAGSALLNPALKHNRFKPVLRSINHFTTGGKLNERTF